MTTNECLQLYIAHFEYQLKWHIYSTIWLLHGWCHAKLLPSRHMSCAPHTTITQCYLKPHIIMFIWSLSACWVISVLAESTNLWHQQKDAYSYEAAQFTVSSKGLLQSMHIILMQEKSLVTASFCVYFNQKLWSYWSSKVVVIFFDKIQIYFVIYFFVFVHRGSRVICGKVYVCLCHALGCVKACMCLFVCLGGCMHVCMYLNGIFCA